MAKESFCLVMWRANGGLIDRDGLPTGPLVESLCAAAEDCANCKFMQAMLNSREEGVNYLWVCPACADESLSNSKELGIYAQLPGYYTAGYCQRPLCRRRDSEMPGAEYSCFLQLLLIAGKHTP